MIAVTGPEVVLESVVDYTVSGALTEHSFPITVPPAGDGTLELVADGDYGSSSETATVSALTGCTSPHSKTIPIVTARMLLISKSP